MAGKPEAKKEKPKPRSSLHRIGIVLAGAIGPYLLVLPLTMGYWIGGSGTETEKLSSACQTIKGIIPVLMLVLFALAVICYTASFFMKQEKRDIARDLALGFLIGGIVGLIIAASAQFMLTMFPTPDFGAQAPTNLSTTFFC